MKKNIKIKNEYYPQSVFHPCVDLKEKLEEIEMGPKEFALRTEKPEKTITAVLNGESSITPDMAVQFEKVLKIPAHFWLKRQYQFDEYNARLENQSILVESEKWAKKFPYREMMKLGWIPKSNAINEVTENLLSFFSIASHKAWENYFFNQKLLVAFRISLKHFSEPYAVSAWLRQGEILASEMEAPDYSEKKLKIVFPELKKVMSNNPADLFNQIQKICMSAGIKVIYTKCLPKAPLNGATRWINDSPLIQLSDRYKRYDIFWFTLFHEIGHILLHGKKDVFIEFKTKKDSKENEADKFAAKCLLPIEQEKIITSQKTINYEYVIKYAKQFNTHPSIIIGRLQHLGLVSYKIDKEFLTPVNFG